jgi:signal transduction histidine kinase
MVKTDVDNYQKIVETNELLESEIALLENLSKNNGVKIAKLLHGPVQGKIAGVVLALRIYANDDKVVTEKDLDKIKSLLISIDDDLESIINPNKEIVQLQLISALDTMKNDWKELIEIDIVSDKSFESTSLNSFTSNIVEVLNEAISNALRHGLADKVEITMEVANGHLNMIVQDNGTGIKKEHAPGFGMSVYKANLFNHSIATGENGGCVLKLTTKVNL